MPYKGERPLLMRMVINLSNEIFNYLKAPPFRYFYERDRILPGIIGGVDMLFICGILPSYI
jgi:hypothetical protein